MRNTLPRKAHQTECGIVNFNTSEQTGTHWVCYFKDGKNERIYFESFSQVTLNELQKYLKTAKEYEMGKAVIQRNTDFVQRVNSHVCGHLCLFVLSSLMREHLSFQEVLNQLKVIGKLPRPKKGFVLPYHKYTGPYNPLDKQLDEFDQPHPGQEPYNAVDAISMRHDICYRDNV